MMTMSPGMLLFAIFDSIVAFFLVYFVTKAKFGGDEKSIARTLAAVLGTLVAGAFFAVLVWFNTSLQTVSDAAQMVVYLAPIVLSILMLILIQLSKPQKKEEEENEDEENSESTNEDDPQDNITDEIG